jgi:TldD protein
MQRITMIGNDMKLDTGIGNCGKGGQGCPSASASRICA